MPSNNSKYTEEMREQTAKFILETGRSATSLAEEMGIDTNTVCRWVRDYRRKHKQPSYAESKGIKAKHPVSDRELIQRNRGLEKELKRKEKLLAEEKEKVEILKKSLHIFMQLPEIRSDSRIQSGILGEKDVQGVEPDCKCVLPVSPQREAGD